MNCRKSHLVSFTAHMSRSSRPLALQLYRTSSLHPPMHSVTLHNRNPIHFLSLTFTVFLWRSTRCVAKTVLASQCVWPSPRTTGFSYFPILWSCSKIYRYILLLTTIGHLWDPLRLRIMGCPRPVHFCTSCAKGRIRTEVYTCAANNRANSPNYYAVHTFPNLSLNGAIATYACRRRPQHQ